MERFLTAEDIRDLLSIAPATFNNMIKDGRFPKPDFGGGMGAVRRWKESTYNQWCEQGCSNGNQIAS
ncbi:helix-turn-helix transcriptional regulator [Vibrio parahaemolyticus]